MTDFAVKVENVSKSFRLYHEKRDTAFEIILGSLQQKKHYEELEVLKNVSFEIKKGEMFGIVGKNAAGKTTLLRIISNIFKPDSGKVTINGMLIPLLSLGIGFEQDLTAKVNVIQYGILLGFKKSEILKKVDAIFEFAELKKFEDTRLKNFSSGMYARLAFSTAMQIDPDIIIIDEALHAGDISFQAKAYDAILSFKKRGKTVIVVTHDMRPIQENCDNALFLNNGEVAAFGNPDDVVKKYIQSLS
jgi:ABC-type polysaccharide/polyol phosphate transport system ATPase subunit|tara:strand:+ start:269 stop:1006 length:738 start_codon:yes stop_codon:yes gene_type:complete